MMKKSCFLALFLLLHALASQGTWCGAEGTYVINGAHLRPHLQVGELHVTEGKKLGQEHEHTHHDEVKIPMRMAIAHRGGSAGGVGGGTRAGGTSVGGRNVNGAADTRPHTGRSSAAAMPAPTSILALAFACAIAVSACSF
ncbi:uncharacterized protein LOC102710719 [Oryza brachyantha]|uniref:Uncharacterized protein n=1 Tax=Oryza brachyantha TaxID=4533 RepID=J3MRQ6_ORYBR|nr:uncharacterized protein LOC102710719 [Oryza brachyantha]